MLSLNIVKFPTQTFVSIKQKQTYLRSRIVRLVILFAALRRKDNLADRGHGQDVALLERLKLLHFLGDLIQIPKRVLEHVLLLVFDLATSDFAGSNVRHNQFPIEAFITGDANE